MRYFFHTIEDGTPKPDDVGIELANDDAARAEAATYLAEIAPDIILNDAIQRFGVEVTDEAGSLVTAIGFTLKGLDH